MVSPIKELCARLCQNNPRGLWEQFGMRDYLKVSNWKMKEKEIDELEDWVKFTLDSVGDDMPGRFVVVTNYECTKVVKIAMVDDMPHIAYSPAGKEKLQLLNDLMYEKKDELIKRLQERSGPKKKGWIGAQIEWVYEDRLGAGEIIAEDHISTPDKPYWLVIEHETGRRSLVRDCEITSARNKPEKTRGEDFGSW